MIPRLVKTIPNVFGDGIASVEHWDFSRGNMNDYARIQHITLVASICYANPDGVGKESLYNRLKAEAAGLPSSSFEFIPVLLTSHRVNILLDSIDISSPTFDTPHVFKYGQNITEAGQRYLLTNYRALLHDQENTTTDITHWFNNDIECEIIAKHHRSYLYKMDQVTAKQHNRHRVALQELSRRYVSGTKVPFEWYISSNMKDVTSTFNTQEITTDDIHKICEAHYYAALSKGVKPQEARRCLPQSMYTRIWSAFLPFQFENYITLRTDVHAQWEIRQLAEAMK